MKISVILPAVQTKQTTFDLSSIQSTLHLQLSCPYAPPVSVLEGSVLHRVREKQLKTLLLLAFSLLFASMLHTRRMRAPADSLTK